VLGVLRLALPAETWIEGAEMAMDVLGRAITGPVLVAVRKTLDSGPPTGQDDRDGGELTQND